jgi:hypothetical protein
MKCPHCGLFNPESAQRCDCGFDFQSKTLKESFLPIKEQQQFQKEQASGFFASEKKGIKKGMAGGIVMMVIAIAWFGGGYAAGFIFYYPPILFLIGLYAFIKGLFTGNISGQK